MSESKEEEFWNWITHSIGIALTLIGIMALFLLFKERFSNHLNAINQRFNTNLIAASIIIIIGALYLLVNMYGGGHQH